MAYSPWYVEPDYWLTGYAEGDGFLQLNAELQKIAPSAVIELFQLELNAAQHGVNETYYFHAGVNATNSGDIIWNGQAYLAFPIEATEFEYTGTGSLPRPKLRISNIYGTITGIILTLPNGLEGAKVTRIRTLARYIDGVNFPGGTNHLGTPDPTAEFPREIYYIDRKASENRDLIEFELAAAFDLVGVRAPKRQCVSNVCQWTYRGPECGYAGNAFFNFNDVPVAAIGQDVCGKRLRSCELRFSQQSFNGTVTVGSNVITLGQSVSFSTGDPVSGFGLPGGTTVSSVAENLVTVNQNSTASTYVTTTGTIQSNFTQIVLSSAAGIIPGMAVFGNYLPANAQVVGVSGNTVTLSSTVDATQFYSVIGFFSGLADRNTIEVATDAAGSVGQLIANSVAMPLSRGAVITNVRYFWAKNGRGFQTEQRKGYIISQSVASRLGALFGIYQFNGIPGATYNFVSTNGNYTFRANDSIPYGSYPGVGTFFT
jgi:lambda family phage minor tail protein L